MTSMKVRTLTVGPVACNCAIVVCPQTLEAAIVDPGGNGDRILAAAREMGAKVRLLLHTHGHFDHVLATREVAQATGAGVAIHRNDRALYENLPQQGTIFGFCAERPPAPTQILEGGEIIAIGSLSARVIHTPGHTPGSVGFYFEANGILLAGDTLFADSIGRTDLPGGSFPDILKSIQGKLYPLPGDTRVIPGHGPETTIAREREENPFIRASSVAPAQP
jgi:hydroxyacylglutathione hydrolase